MTCTAIVLAGSRPGVDSFAAEHGTDLKALIPVAGKPMVRWPVEALLATKAVGTVRVLAQQPERVGAVLPADPRLTVGLSGTTIAATLATLCGDASISWPLLVTTADHVLLDRAMVDEFIGSAAGAEAAIGVVEREPLLKRFPNARRTWLKFRGGAYSGANLFLLAGPQVAPAIGLWRSIEQDRKKGWRLVLKLGPLLFAGAALRLLTLDQVVERVSRRLGIAVRAVRLSNPIAAIDVDKASDHRLAEAIIAGRA